MKCLAMRVVIFVSHIARIKFEATSECTKAGITRFCYFCHLKNQFLISTNDALLASNSLKYCSVASF